MNDKYIVIKNHTDPGYSVYELQEKRNTGNVFADQYYTFFTETDKLEQAINIADALNAKDSSDDAPSWAKDATPGGVPWNYQ